nr:DNA recombination protein RmuC [Comamonas jiangduensis]
MPCLLLGGLLLVLVAHLLHWLTPRPAPAVLAMLARLEHLERALQLTQMAIAKSDGALGSMGQQVQGLVHSLGHNQTAAADSLRELVGTHMQRQTEEARHSRQELQQHFAQLQQALALQLQRLNQDSHQTAEQLRGTLNERLATIQADNAAKLEEMRRTVDESCTPHWSSVWESFKLVSERLEQVHKGLGEMQSLASSVGDLKRVMTNVKTRGTWGEVQLGGIIDNVLTPEQYARNVKTVPGSDELVEFAIRLPGRDDEHPVWLPIDAKYPVEHYQRLQDALDAATSRR